MTCQTGACAPWKNSDIIFLGNGNRSFYVLGILGQDYGDRLYLIDACIGSVYAQGVLIGQNISLNVVLELEKWIFHSIVYVVLFDQSELLYPVVQKVGNIDILVAVQFYVVVPAYRAMIGADPAELFSYMEIRPELDDIRS